MRAPEKLEGPLGGGPIAEEVTESEAILARTADSRKRVATLAAVAALSGFSLTESDDDRGRPIYVVTRGALTERLTGLDDVERWLAGWTDMMNRHRQDWAEHRTQFPLDRLKRSFGAGNRAKISAEVLAIRQKHERAAYGLEDSRDAG